ncbi:hypothetical protein ACSLBF_15955 [Pseudoalteromonas sp. T1lg65]|uniref:hypothetical protein n=1 Tax=Pseudoalteromonas sp. T1lg65 TaxID=2077101 RepID=UPI003F78B478
MKLQLKKKQLKSLKENALSNLETNQVAGARGATFGSRIDCNSYVVCHTHPAICQSIGLCPSKDICYQ